MKNDLVIFHYHLFPGGVTNVVMLSVRSLLESFPELAHIRLVCGSDLHLLTLLNRLAELGEEMERKVSIEVVPEIYYLTRDASPGGPGVPETAAVKRLLLERFGGALWWIHNYHLGKNPVFTQALLEIAAESPAQRMLLHIHDFPECARYDNLALLDRFVTLPLYPTSANVRYALINSRDQTLLTDAGIPSTRAFLLDNPVPGDTLPEVDTATVRSRLERGFAGRFPSYQAGAPLLFYPVRTIRRKNVLEAGLIARMMDGPGNLVVTLPGVSEREAPYSALVEECFTDGLIPGMWGVGSHLSEAGIGFQELALSVDCVVSSSVQEGFGYLFIDGRRWQKPVFARYLDVLDGITDAVDDESAYFYREVMVPVEGDIRRRTLEAYHRRAEEILPYLPEGSGDSLFTAIDEGFSGDSIEFSYLSVDDQRDLLSRAAPSDLRGELTELNRPLLTALADLTQRRAPDIAERIQSRFSLRAFAATASRIVDSFEDEPSSPSGSNCGGTADGDAVHRNLRRAFGTLPYIRLLYQ